MSGSVVHGKDFRKLRARECTDLDILANVVAPLDQQVNRQVCDASMRSGYNKFCHITRRSDHSLAICRCSAASPHYQVAPTTLLQDAFELVVCNI